ncbi:MAG: dethiobiotin synthase, partial [Deltaproteobacteria bacterium]
MPKLKKIMPDICVIGTDTNVGKTVVSLLLMYLFGKHGFSPFYLKPFQTGCATPFDSESDAQFIRKYMNGIMDIDVMKSTLFCHHEPKAPWLSARNQGEKIDSDRLFDFIEKIRREHNPIIIEASGGLMVPINEETLFVDIIAKTKARPILVARTGLGTINHTLLSLLALQAKGIVPLGIVF